MEEVIDLTPIRELITKKVQPDGLVFDLCIQKTTFDDYRNIYNGFVQSEYQLVYYRDLEDEKLPDEFITITDDVDANHNIQVEFGFGTFSWLLYNETTITFELDSEEFEDGEDVEEIIVFMQFLNKVTGKSVGFYLEDGLKPLVELG
ncbi:MAG: hypothetical protein OCD01_15640 [Fibrobacterales bacterium]